MNEFDNVLSRRNTGSYKWDKPQMRGVLPMWVADMDFAAAAEILEAIKARVDHGVFGYAQAPDSLSEVVVDRMWELYQWRIKPEWLVWLPGLETSLTIASSSIGGEGDSVMTLAPIYPPFYTGPRFAGKDVLEQALDIVDGTWALDFEKLEQRFLQNPKLKLLLFCNPHNPLGKVYSQAELMRLGQLCLKYKIKICSDEVHCDLILNGKTHFPLASLNSELENQCITLMAPSKTFNIAGLGCGFAIIADAKWRQSFQLSMRGWSPMVNVMGYVACEAAYRYGEPWRRKLIEYLKGNVRMIEAALSGPLQSFRWVKPEATYLAWLDTTVLGEDDAALMFRRHGLGLSAGHTFGKNGWVRLNFGCPKATLKEGLARMERAILA